MHKFHRSGTLNLTFFTIGRITIRSLKNSTLLLPRSIT